MFVKKTSLPNSVEIIGYIKCYMSSSPTPVKSASNSLRYNSQKICSSPRRPETILEIRIKASVFKVINKPVIYKFVEDFSSRRKNTNRVVVFSCRPFLNILKYRNPRGDLPTIWKTRFFQTRIEEFS